MTEERQLTKQEMRYIEFCASEERNKMIDELVPELEQTLNLPYDRAYNMAMEIVDSKYKPKKWGK